MLILITDLGGHMDLSTINGLTEEQSAAITAMYNTDTEGLRNKNTELLDEKSKRKTASDEQEQALVDARQVAATAKEDALKAANDMDGLKSHYEEQLAEQTATAKDEAKKSKGLLLSRDKGLALSKALSLIHDDYKGLAEAQLSNMIKIGYNDLGEANTTFEHEGKVIANNVEEFKSWASEQASFKKILNGVDSSGAGTQQSRGASGAADTLEACKGDKKLEAEYFNKQLLG